LKPTLGAGGSALPTIIRPNGSAAFGLDLLPLKECSLLDEQFIFQEQVDIAEEYRVHSIEDSVIPGLTYLRHTPHSTDVRSTGKPESFVQEVLNALPSGMTRDSLCGWDIAIDCNGKPFVIEVNYSGMHSVYRPGFQCSGFFHTRPLAVQCLARLIDFMGSMYGVELEIESPPRSLDKYYLIFWVVLIFW